MASISPSSLSNYSEPHSGKNSYIKLTITEITQTNGATNQTTVKWKITLHNAWSTLYRAYVTLGNKVLYDGKPEKTNWSEGYQLSSGTSTFDNNSDGTLTLTAYVKQLFYYGNGVPSRWDNPNMIQEKSVDMVCSQIPRQANLTSAPDFNDEENPTINYTNSAGSSVNSLDACISLDGSTDDVPYRAISKTGTSYTFNLTETERNTLRNATTTSNSRTVKFYVRTVIGNTTFYSVLDKTLTIVNGNPTFTNSQISYQDTNSSVVAITENNQHIVRNNSNLQVSFTGATAKKGASISRYEVTFNGSTQNKSSASTINYGVVNISSNTAVSIKVVDSRGNSTTISKTITIFDWVLPSAVISARRLNNYEDDTTIKVQATISSVNSKNAIQSIKYRYKKTSDNSYNSYTTINNNTNYSISIDKLYAYNFQFVIQDKFGTTTYNLIVAKGTPIMFIDVLLKSVGINCFPKNADSFEVKGFNFDDLHPVNSVLITATNTDPSSYVNGTWVLLTSQTINGNTIYYWKRTL